MSSRKRKLEEGDNEEVAFKQIHLASSSPAPFSTEVKKPEHFERISLEDAEKGNYQRPIRIYCDGIYDMFHAGHARQLMQAKAKFQSVYLLVGIVSDELTHRLKGRTVMTDLERYECLRHCRYVDEVVTDAPWELTDEFLDDHQIDFVAHDDLPYTLGTSNDDVYSRLKGKGMFLATQRTPGVSTSDVITRIVKDYDVYVRRNLNRGYNRQELNIGPIHESRIKVAEKYSSFKTEICDKFSDVKESIRDIWHESSSSGLVRSFLELYHPLRFAVPKWDQIKNAISPPNSPSPGTDEEIPTSSSFDDKEETEETNSD